MAKVKKYLTKQEDKQETNDAAVKEQRGIDTALYNRGELSIDEFMSKTFGGIGIVDEEADEPAETFLIDFQ